MTGGSLNFKDFFRKLAVLLLDVFIASSTVGGAWVKGCNTPLPAHNCCVSRREVQKKNFQFRFPINTITTTTTTTTTTSN